jgi:predicted negative regulator of RcsB-dependent stress response
VSEHLNDQLYQEELERVVGWWRRNAGRILVALFVALALVAGERWYVAHRAAERKEAAVRYAAVTGALAHGSLARADRLARTLLRRHPSSPYALFAALTLARKELAAGRVPEALFFARWARRHPGPKAWRPLVLFRVAEIELSLQHPHRARALLKGVDPGRYALLFALVRAQADRALHRPHREFDALGLVATLAPAGSGWGRWARRVRASLLTRLAAPASATAAAPRASAPVLSRTKGALRP